MKRIEALAAHVKTELDAWDDRARIDEEHPPYAKLVGVLDDLIKTCRKLREEGPFATEPAVSRQKHQLGD